MSYIPRPQIGREKFDVSTVIHRNNTLHHKNLLGKYIKRLLLFGYQDFNIIFNIIYIYLYLHLLFIFYLLCIYSLQKYIQKNKEISIPILCSKEIMLSIQINMSVVIFKILFFFLMNIIQNSFYLYQW